jgi:hypothetical protein
VASGQQGLDGNRRFVLSTVGAALSVIVVLFIVLDMRILSLARSVERLALKLEQFEPAPIALKEMSTSYKALHNGQQVTHTVTDTWNGTETAAELRARHYAHVTADQEGDWPIVLT